MLEMLLDTSSTVLYIAFVNDKKVIFESITEGKNNHSDNLLKNIEEGLNNNSLNKKLEIKDFDRIILGKGPGMYTGLRVSMTVAKMFAWTLNIPLYVISSIDLLVSDYFDKDGVYAIMLKAKKDHSYTKVIKVKNQKIEIVRAEEFMNNEEFMKALDNENIKYDCMIDNSNMKINTLEIANYEELQELVTNIHALEPNYLRADI